MTKTPDELAAMAHSGRLLASVFGLIDQMQLIGMSTLEVNDRVERFIVDELKSRPASKGQYGFEYVLNSSVNDVVCHAIPSAKEILKDGDIVNFDITLEKNGYIADSSKTYMLGNVSAPARRLVRTTYEAMWKGIRAVRPGATLGDIGHAIERHAKGAGYSIVREFCGHGIGREMHEEPSVLHFGRRGVYTEEDDWTVRTEDGKLSAQFEHTVAVTERGVDVLTLRPEEAHLVKDATRRAG